MLVGGHACRVRSPGFTLPRQAHYFDHYKARDQSFLLLVGRAIDLKPGAGSICTRLNVHFLECRQPAAGAWIAAQLEVKSMGYSLEDPNLASVCIPGLCLFFRILLHAVLSWTSIVKKHSGMWALDWITAAAPGLHGLPAIAARTRHSAHPGHAASRRSPPRQLLQVGASALLGAADTAACRLGTVTVACVACQPALSSGWLGSCSICTIRPWGCQHRMHANVLVLFS